MIQFLISHKRFIYILLCLPILLIAFFALQIYSYAFVSDSSPADAAIVLGASAWQDQPSPVFAARIDHAMDLYHAGQVHSLIFTGGVGPGKKFPEGEVASEYAIQAGIPQDRIYFEGVSTDTVENLQQAKKIVESLNFHRVLIVSDPYHMKRAVLIARDLGLDAYPSPTPYSRYQSFYLRMRFLFFEIYKYSHYLWTRSQAAAL